MYDYLIVGSGLFGSTFASLAKRNNRRVLLLEKQNKVGGGIQTDRRDGIDVHIYGAHIFHTSDEKIYNYFSSFSKMVPFVNQVIANYKGRLFNLPFNMNTFNQMWNVKTSEQAKAIIDKQIEEANIKEITNLEQQAISMVGTDIYKMLVKGYTEKQWGRDCKDLPPSIIKRLPVRFEYNNNYFNDTYQGVPEDGYSKVIERMLNGVDVRLNVDYLKCKEKYKDMAKIIIYTGEIDRYFDYVLGRLQYRTLRFEIEKHNTEYYQNNPVINFTDRETPYTRLYEHKYFANQKSNVTYITKEYPKEFEEGDSPYYPINDERNNSLYLKYLDLATNEKNVFFAGRLGQYKYFDMDDTMIEAFKLFDNVDKKLV